MSNILKIAKNFTSRGYSVIPVSPVTKLPTIANWGKYQIAPMPLDEVEKHFSTAEGIALLMGGSTRLVALDADMKYDLTGDLWERFKAAVPNKILKKCYCQATKNKGYHLVFIAPESRLVGSEKLASRHTTAFEKHITYMSHFNNPETRGKALTIASSDKSKVLFETRSGNTKIRQSYILLSPTPGYTAVYGKLNELSEDEYDILMETARSFNEYKTVDGLPKKLSDKSTSWKVTPLDHYNESGDVVQLLLDYGWEIVDEYGKNIRFKRPGQTHAKSSAMFDITTRIFNCFSTSTDFDCGKGYSPVGVFMLLKCNNDPFKAYETLAEEGWGEQLEKLV
jgi:hypothetical protein